MHTPPRLPQVCQAGGFHALSRPATLAYYIGMLAYYWVLAIPAMAGVFGLYLYASLCFCHVHFDEAFSSLRIPDYKGFSRWVVGAA